MGPVLVARLNVFVKKKIGDRPCPNGWSDQDGESVTGTCHVQVTNLLLAAERLI